MKKTIAIIGSAAALSFAGAGLATAQDAGTPEAGQATQETTADGQTTEGETEGQQAGDDVEATDPETPAEVSEIAQQLCGTVTAYDFLGSAGAIVPGLSGDECEANADLAVEAAMSGDIGGALDILRGIEAGTPGEDGETGETDKTEVPGSADGLLETVGSAQGEDTTGGSPTEGDDVSAAGA